MRIMTLYHHTQFTAVLCEMRCSNTFVCALCKAHSLVTITMQTLCLLDIVFKKHSFKLSDYKSMLHVKYNAMVLLYFHC